MKHRKDEVLAKYEEFFTIYLRSKDLAELNSFVDSYSGIVYDKYFSIKNVYFMKKALTLIVLEEFYKSVSL